MKTNISPDGTLTIKPETELEAYALSQWCKTSFTESTNEATSQFIGKLHVTGELDKKPAITPYSGQSAVVDAVTTKIAKELEGLILNVFPNPATANQALTAIMHVVDSVRADFRACGTND